jgi:hypothetical protein
MDHLAKISRLKDLVAALDGRHRQPERAGEAAIAQDATELRARAVKRLAELQAYDSPAGAEDGTP